MNTTTSGADERNALRECLPWLVNGTLDDPSSHALHELIRSDLPTRRDWQETRALAEFVAGEETLAPDIGRSLQHLPPQTRAPRARAGAWAAAAAIAVIAAAGVLVLRSGAPQHAPQYATLSAPTTPATVTGVRLRVQLATDIPAAQLEDALRPYGGRLVAGPEAPGLYTIALPDQHTAAATRMLEQRFRPLHVGPAAY